MAIAEQDSAASTAHHPCVRADFAPCFTFASFQNAIPVVRTIVTREPDCGDPSSAAVLRAIRN